MIVRFCLVCGARLRIAVEEGRRRKRCPRCGWTFYANPVPATAAVIVEAGRMLLGRRARPPYAGAWDVPGGFLEPGEHPFAGLERELREELGVGVRHAVLIGFATDVYGPRGFAVLTAVYRVRPTSRRVHPADDVSALHWFPVDRVPYRQIPFPSVRQVIGRYLSR